MLAVSLLLSALSLALADLDYTVTSRFQIEVPATLFREEGYNHREALFGKIPYGNALSQTVYWADSELCDDFVDRQKGYPCRYDATGKCAPWGWMGGDVGEVPYILMVDRGSCSFVRKVQNAQKAGAAAVLIADSICTCDALQSGACKSNEGDDAGLCQGLEPIMADDGSGGDITIPSFLLFKQDADAMKDVLRGNPGLLRAKMTWNTPAPDNRVEWSLYHSPTEASTKHFQKVFGSESKGLGKHSFFTPHYAIWSRPECIGNSACDGLCTNHGRYCADDPDGVGHITGADVVRETLRRLCIWQKYGEDGIGEKWWAYGKEFINACDNEAHPARFPSLRDNSCAMQTMKKVGIDSKAIEECMKISGGTDGNGDNNLLEKEVGAAFKAGIVAYPAISINTKLMFGNINNRNVFSAICAGFLDGTQPDVCSACESCSANELEGCALTKECGGNGGSGGGNRKGGGVGAGTIFLSVFMTVSIMGGGMFFYWKRQQNEMRDQVRGILAEYMPLDDDKGRETGLVSSGSGGL